MTRALDLLSLLLLLGAGLAFTLGVRALGARDDLVALYWLGVGVLTLRATVELSRPRGGLR